MAVTFDPGKHCGAAGRQTGRPCTLAKGWGTSHPGVARCRFHGGNTPSQVKAAQREIAVRAVTKLGIPLGTGDPFELLAHTVQHAEGQLAASAAILVETSAYVEANKADGPRPLVEDIKVAADIYSEAIRTAGRTGKAAVDAKVADRQVSIDLALANLLNRFVTELLDRVVPKDQRPEVEVWAKGRFAELAVEFEHMAGRAN